MRQIFTVRFFAAVGAVAALFLLLTAAFQTQDTLVVDPTDDEVRIRAIDFVDEVFSSSNPRFDFEDGAANFDTELVIDGARSLNVVAGTPGVNYCPNLATVGGCAVVADLLGEAVVWMALVPSARSGTVELPAIDVLDGGIATLVNGWKLRHAPVLDRRCPEDDFGSYRELRNELDDDFVSIFTIEEQRITAVVCRQQVELVPQGAAAVRSQHAWAGRISRARQ